MGKKVIDDRGALTTDDPGKEENIEDEFAAAFDNAESGDDPGNKEPEDKEPEDKEPEDKEPEDKEPEDKEPEDKEPEDNETDTQRYKTLQGILKHEREVWKEERDELLQKVADADKASEVRDESSGDAKQTAAEKVKTFMDSLTDEEKEQIKEYDREFDVISRMEGLKRTKAFASLKAEMEELKSDILARIEEQGSQLAPIIQRTESVAETQHFNTVKEVHADFEAYRDDGSLLGWIESKPSYMRPALKDVYENGEAEDVIDMITDFKLENDIPLEADLDASDDGNLDDEKGAEVDAALKAQREKKKKALKSVKTGRSAVSTSQVDPDDFDSAFNEAEKKASMT